MQWYPRPGVVGGHIDDVSLLLDLLPKVGVENDILSVRHEPGLCDVLLILWQSHAITDAEHIQ